MGKKGRKGSWTWKLLIAAVLAGFVLSSVAVPASAAKGPRGPAWIKDDNGTGGCQKGYSLTYSPGAPEDKNGNGWVCEYDHLR